MNICTPYHLVDRSDQMCLTALVLHQSIPHMAHGGDGQEDLASGINSPYDGQGIAEGMDEFGNWGELPAKLLLGKFMAVGHQHDLPLNS